nr:Gfo/Idh/MocA family oxidoreductase [Pseudonocardiales bacterium]
PDRAGAFADDHHDMTAAPDIEALLDHGLDAVYVCVPPFAHGPVEDGLLESGLPLFIEKPPAADLATAERIGSALLARSTVTRVGLHWRLGEPVRRARELLAGRTVRLVQGTWWDKVPPVPWWTDPARSGGQVVEQAVHVLDLARVLVGEVSEVSAIADSRSAGAHASGVAPATAALMRFGCGALGTLTTTCALSWKAQAGLRVVADGAVIDVSEGSVQVNGPDGTRRWTADPDDARVHADRAFVDAVRDAAQGGGRAGEPADLPDYAEALRSHRLACAVARAVTSGTVEHP